MSDFYETNYGKRVTVPQLEGLKRLFGKLSFKKGQVVQIMDLGCGDGTCGAKVLQMFRDNSPSDVGFELTGWDISLAGVEEAKKKGINAIVKDACAPIDKEWAGKFDVVLSIDVLEHIFDTGVIIDNAFGLLKEGGALILVTPNLAAWYSRIQLLLGHQPHGTEVSSDPVRFGNQYIAKLLKEKPDASTAAGHIRLFTYKALKEFLEYHSFEVKAVVGINNVGGVFAKCLGLIWPGGAGEIGVLAKKKPRC